MQTSTASGDHASVWACIEDVNITRTRKNVSRVHSILAEHRRALITACTYDAMQRQAIESPRIAPRNVPRYGIDFVLTQGVANFASNGCSPCSLKSVMMSSYTVKHISSFCNRGATACAASSNPCFT